MEVSVVKGHGKLKKRSCVVAKDGRFRMFYGCFGSSAKANARASALRSGRSGVKRSKRRGKKK